MRLWFETKEDDELKMERCAPAQGLIHIVVEHPKKGTLSGVHTKEELVNSPLFKKSETLCYRVVVDGEWTEWIREPFSQAS